MSVMGLGSGGASQIGRRTGRSEAESVTLVRQALDAGVNVFDTAESYGTEDIIGRALAETPRAAVVISTKKTSVRDGLPVTADEVIDGLHQSLKWLHMDYVDIYHLHGVAPDHYAQEAAELVPVMRKLRQEGKIRFLGITEAFESDQQHRMLRLAVQDDCWDVMMVGFNILNQSARTWVLPEAIRKQIGMLGMFAVRKAFSRPTHLIRVLRDLQARGKLGSDLAENDEALEFLIHAGGATDLQDAAYRFCRHEPGMHVVLSGTGDVAHLAANLASLAKPPLPVGDLEKLNQLFHGVEDVSGG